MPGMDTSRTRTSGGRRAIAARAAGPPSAVRTRNPCSRSPRSSERRTASSSSTTRTSPARSVPLIRAPSLGPAHLVRPSPGQRTVLGCVRRGALLAFAECAPAGLRADRGPSRQGEGGGGGSGEGPGEAPRQRPPGQAGAAQPGPSGRLAAELPGRGGCGCRRSGPLDGWSRPFYARRTLLWWACHPWRSQARSPGRSRVPPPPPSHHSGAALSTARRTRTRFRSRAAAALTALALPLAALVGLASPAQAATSATATYAKSSDWGTGFGAGWTIKNTGTTALSSWTVEWDYPSGTSVTSAWDADVTSSGNHWTAKNKSLQRHPRPRREHQLRLQRRGLRAPPRAASSTAVPATAVRRRRPATTRPPPPARRPRATSPTPG